MSMSWDFGIFFIEACARLYESSTASGANVGDITPCIPKYPFIMINIFIIYRVMYAGILKTLNQQPWAGI
jgi:hypothetical protein